MQKRLMLFSLLIVSLVGVFCTPFLARFLSVNDFKIIGILLVFNAFYGVFDILKPVYIKRFSVYFNENKKIPFYYFKLNFLLAVLFSLIVFLVCFFFYYGILGFLGAFLISSSSFFSFLSIYFVSVVESNNRVGTSFFVRSLFIIVLYLLFFMADILGGGVFYFYFYLLAFLFLFLTYCSLSLRDVDFKILNQTDELDTKEVVHTLELNAFKVIIDFSDRLILVGFFNAKLYAAYLALYDLLSKSNIVAQYFANYSYPKLLANNTPDTKYKFIKISLVIFILMVIFSLFVSFFSKQIILLYLGSQYINFFYIIPLLSLMAVFFCLAFFTQVLLRIEGDFKLLAYFYRVSATLGLISLIALLFFEKFNYIFLSILIMKSPGLFPFFKILKNTLSFVKFNILIFFIVSYINLIVWLSYQSFSTCVFYSLGIFFVFLLLSAKQKTEIRCEI
ncbi:hypothetical protein NQ646_16730 [Acinetobacter baumannii]|nr:hypothetical protein [Acinetobacter baumannii]MDC5578808.1 hypothetical protein [Acinetobacter baumannii]MDO7186041.1 hypothetical protein [Acinetobacter baumannii]